MIPLFILLMENFVAFYGKIGILKLRESEDPLMAIVRSLPAVYYVFLCRNELSAKEKFLSSIGMDGRRRHWLLARQARRSLSSF